EQPPKPGATSPNATGTPLAPTSTANRDSGNQAAASTQAPAWSLSDGFGKTISLSQYQGRQVVVIFYEGAGCIRCQKQLNSFAQKVKEFAGLGIALVGIGIDSPEEL